MWTLSQEAEHTCQVLPAPSLNQVVKTAAMQTLSQERGVTNPEPPWTLTQVCAATSRLLLHLTCVTSCLGSQAYNSMMQE